MITVQLTTDELHRICLDLASELRAEMCHDDFDGEDFASILKGWRECSSRYVASGSLTLDAEELEGVHTSLDETADLLAKLLAQLPPPISDGEHVTGLRVTVESVDVKSINGHADSVEARLSGDFNGTVYAIGGNGPQWKAGNTLVGLQLRGKALTSGRVIAVVEGKRRPTFVAGSRGHRAAA